LSHGPCDNFPRPLPCQIKGPHAVKIGARKAGNTRKGVLRILGKPIHDFRTPPLVLPLLDDTAAELDTGPFLTYCFKNGSGFKGFHPSERFGIRINKGNCGNDQTACALP